MSLKRKVISAVTAVSLSAGAAAIAPSVYAINSGNHTVRLDDNGQTYYKDNNGNTVYDEYVLDKWGNIVYDCFFDSGRNALIGLHKENNKYYDQYGNRISSSYVYDRFGNKVGISTLFDNYDNYKYNNSNYQIYNPNVVYNTNPNYNYNYDPNYNYNCNPNSGYYNGNDYVNVDIDDPNILNRYLEMRDGQLYYGNTRVDNHGAAYNNGMPQQHWDPNVPQMPPYGAPINGQYNPIQNPIVNENYYVTPLYTLVKTQWGKTVYAYSPVADVYSAYGISGWRLNSIYNENDYALNSVFYEEVNSFGNDIRTNPYTVDRINNATNLYIWRYQSMEGTKYCVSTVKDPIYPGFVYNSTFNINDLGPLKTADAVMYTLVKRGY